MPTRVFLDANVLVPRVLKWWIFHLKTATNGSMFTVVSTEDVITEALRAIRKTRPDLPGKVISDLRSALEVNIEDIVSDFAVEEWMLEGDKHDGHVRAACQQHAVDILVTCDHLLLADPANHPQLRYDVMTPDDFLVLVDDSTPGSVFDLVSRKVKWARETGNEVDLPGELRRVDCPQFATRVTRHLHQLM